MLVQLDKEDADEEARGHKRKRKEPDCSLEEKGLFYRIAFRGFILLTYITVDMSPKRPKSDGEGKSKKYGNQITK